MQSATNRTTSQYKRPDLAFILHLMWPGVIFFTPASFEGGALMFPDFRNTDYRKCLFIILIFNFEMPVLDR
jgi:hypothetical protein